ncbi:MAG: nucleoside-diphosphate sugar epimerase, partial [Novosphingobium sp. 35-62-5]
MKVLVVGGTGALGGHAALHLAAQGHDVTITGRGAGAPEGTALTTLGFLQGDYVAGDFTPDRLR